MSIADLTFIGNIRFSVQCGKVPIIIIGSHAYSVGDDSYDSVFDGDITLNEEKRLHSCDFAVKPILDELRKKDLFYIIENETSRSVVDMNRSIARGDDNIDNNDNLFRQGIRYMCDFIRRIHKKNPIVIDLHSFSPTSNWGDNEIMILEQTKHGMKSNKSLMELTYNYFSDLGWEIAIEDEHNQDDIVEEIAYRNIGIPLLIEINEKILNENTIEDKENLISNLCKYFEIIDAKNPSIISAFTTNFDAKNQKPSLLPSKVDQLRNDLKTLNEKEKLSPLESTYEEYLQLALKSLSSSQSVLTQKTDSVGYENISSLHDSISGHSVNEMDNIQNTLYTISNQNDSILIPLELFSVWLDLYYAEINRKLLQEWGIESELLIEAFVNNEFQNTLLIAIPKYEFPLVFEDFIYGTYGVNSQFYIGYAILYGNIANISAEGLEKDMNHLRKWAKLSDEQEKKMSERNIDGKLINHFRNTFF